MKHYRQGSMFRVEEAPFIEDGIRPIAVALSQWDCFKLEYSCEGHPQEEGRNWIPYVAFQYELWAVERGGATIDKLKRRIEGTGWGIFAKDTKCGFSLGREVWWKEKDKVLHGIESKRLAGFTIRPDLRRKKWATVDAIARLIRPKTPKCDGFVYYHKDQV